MIWQNLTAIFTHLLLTAPNTAVTDQKQKLIAYHQSTRRAGQRKPNGKTNQKKNQISLQIHQKHPYCKPKKMLKMHHKTASNPLQPAQSSGVCRSSDSQKSTHAQRWLGSQANSTVRILGGTRCQPMYKSSTYECWTALIAPKVKHKSTMSDLDIEIKLIAAIYDYDYLL